MKKDFVTAINNANKMYPPLYGEYTKELWIDRREKRKSLDRQGTVCCAWEKTAFEEGLKGGMRLMVEVLGV